jgi:serine/threonine-protein kinase
LLDRLLAVKVLHRSTVRDPDVRDRLHAEARAAARVQHPNVVTVFGVDLRGDPPYIAMEFVRGLTLAETVRERGMGVPMLIDIAVQTANRVSLVVSRLPLPATRRPSPMLPARRVASAWVRPTPLRAAARPAGAPR